MVVDDEALIRWSIEARCRRRGFTVLSVDTGEAALDKLALAQVDVMILDVSLPGIDGVTTLARALQMNPNLPVIMISAHCTDDFVAEVLKQGAAEFLSKPFPLELLDAAVERALAGAKTVRRPAGGPGWVLGLA